MVINIVSSHRFHLLDLARELSAQGHDVRYYSYVSAKRCAQFGIDPSLCSCFFWLVWPFFALERLLPQSCLNLIVWYRNMLMDWYLCRTMRRCDVLIVMGYVYHDCMLTAKRKWNALTVLEWGSKHITEQLKQIHGEDKYLQRQLRRDLDNYQICDYISVPATHSLKSFLKHGIPIEKLFVNPYGVDLSQFGPTTCSHQFDLIFVGGWRFEKGCDLIVELCQKHHYRFIHVGALVNMPFPEVENMVHFDPVDQKELVKYYAMAKVFILPSRAEGLSLVQAQAIACGLPVVCSQETGGIDLRNQLSCKEWIFEMRELSVDALHDGVEAALALASGQQWERDYLVDDRHILSWEAYGERYDDFLHRSLTTS